MEDAVGGVDIGLLEFCSGHEDLVRRRDDLEGLSIDGGDYTMTTSANNGTGRGGKVRLTVDSGLE